MLTEIALFMYIAKIFVKKIKTQKFVIYILLNKDGVGATIAWLQNYIRLFRW